MNLSHTNRVYSRFLRMAADKIFVRPFKSENLLPTSPSCCTTCSLTNAAQRYQKQGAFDEHEKYAACYGPAKLLLSPKYDFDHTTKCILGTTLCQPNMHRTDALRSDRYESAQNRKTYFTCIPVGNPLAFCRPLTTKLGYAPYSIASNGVARLMEMLTSESLPSTRETPT